MSYTDAEWNNVMHFLNSAAEKRPPAGIGKPIETADEFVQMLRTAEAIKPAIVGDEVLKNRREFAELERQKSNLDRTVIDTQDQIDNHPGNPNNP
jgi:hypothetical protein